MRKGFTSIELLAVIVILAIIALIAVPIVIHIIDDTKASSEKESVELYIDSVKKAVARKQLEKNNFNPATCEIQEDGNLLCGDIEIVVDMKGVKAINGIIEFSNGKIIEEETWIKMSNNSYYCYKNNKITKLTEDEIKLPKEYQKVEYIESTDEQYIDTLFKGNQDTKIICEAIITDSFKSGYYQGLFGATDTVGQKEINRNVVHMHRYTSSELIVMATYGDKIVTKGFKGDITQKHIYELDKNIFKVDNNTIYTYDYISFESTQNINIFRDNNNKNSSQNKRYCKMKLYSFLLYDDDKLVLNFVPCYSKTKVKDANGKEQPKNTIGLYDLVEGKFYTNQGTGEFIKGPDV